MSEVAVLLVRGRINISTPIKDTLDQLGLNKKHACSVIKLDAHTKGMLQKVKDYCTWGSVSADTVAKLKSQSRDEKRIRANLHPPRGGYERKGIKHTYKNKGVLGDRGEAMDKLVQRML